MKKLQKKQSTRAPKITLETLAGMVAQGFEGINRRFESTDQRFESFVKETRENFVQVRRDILAIRDTYATKDQLRTAVSRIEILEKNVVIKK